MIKNKFKYVLPIILATNLINIKAYAIELRDGHKYITSMEDLKEVGIQQDDLNRYGLTLQDLINMNAFLEEFKVTYGQEEHNEYILGHYEKRKEKEANNEPLEVYDINGKKILLNSNEATNKKDYVEDKYVNWRDNDWKLTNVVIGQLGHPDSYPENLIDKLKIIVRIYNAETNEYVGEAEAENKGATYLYNPYSDGSEENNTCIGIKYSVPNKFNGLYSSQYFKYNTAHFEGTLENLGEGTGTYSGFVDAEDLEKGIIYVNSYYFNEIQQGWLEKNNNWCYLQDGQLTKGWFTDTNRQSKGQYIIRNITVYMAEYTWYYFDESGIMQTGWKLIDGNWYYFYNDGTMATNTVINGYHLNSNGAWDY